MPQLELHILGARGLFNTQIVGTIDPYCIVKYEGKKWETNVCEDSKNPQWDTIFRFAINDPATAELRFSIRNKNPFFDDTLGECTLKLGELARGVATERVIKLEKCLGKEADLRVELTAIDFGAQGNINGVSALRDPLQQQQQAPPPMQQQQPYMAQPPPMMPPPPQPYATGAPPPPPPMGPPGAFGAQPYPYYQQGPPMLPPSHPHHQQHPTQGAYSTSASPQSYASSTPPVPPTAYDMPSPPMNHCIPAGGPNTFASAPPPPQMPPPDAYPPHAPPANQQYKGPMQPPAMNGIPPHQQPCQIPPSKGRGKRRHGHHHGHGHGSHGRNWKPWLHHPEMAQPVIRG